MANYHSVGSVRVVDTEGVKTSKDQFFLVADTVTLATIVAQMQAYFALLDPVTDAAGLQGQFTIKFPSTGLKTAATVKNQVGNTGLFTFTQTGSLYVQSDDVPAFAESKITGSKVDLTDADVIAYYQWFTTAHSGLQPVGKYDNFINTFRNFKLTDRKHRRSLTNVSAEPAP